MPACSRLTTPTTKQVHHRPIHAELVQRLDGAGLVGQLVDGHWRMLARIRPTSDRCCRLARCAESTRYRIQSTVQPQWVCGQQGRAKWLLVRPATHSCFSAVIFVRLRFLFVCLSPGVSHCPPPTSSPSRPPTPPHLSVPCLSPSMSHQARSICDAVQTQPPRSHSREYISAR